MSRAPLSNMRALDAEEAAVSVLGSVLLDNSALDRIATLKPADFADRSHRLIFEQMQRLAEAREPVDVITLATALSKAGTLDGISGLSRKGEMERGVDYLSYLSNASASAIAVKHHAGIVRDRARARELMEVASEMHRAASDGDYDDADTLLEGAAESVLALTQQAASRSMAPLSAAMREAVEQVRAAYERGDALAGLSTGFDEIDRLTGGLEGGQFIILAGRPAMGKTGLGINLATNVAKAGGVTVAVFSLEMGASELAKRVMSSEGRIDAGALKTGVLAQGDIDRMLQTVKVDGALPLYIDDTPAVGLAHIRAECRRLMSDKARPPLGLVVIDYLQLMTGNTKGNREQEISGIARGLKGLAKALSVPVVALSQLSRKCEDRADKRPQLADLRESGAIEQDADVVAFVYRDDYYNDDSAEPGIAEVIFAKNRSGATGTAKLKWTGKWTRFDNINPGGY